MATYATLTVPVRDIIGAEFDERRASVWITPNTEDGVILADSIRVGGRREQVVAGVATFANLVTTNSATNPTSFAYRVTITAPPKGARSKGDLVELTTSDFPLTASANLKDITAAWDGIAVPPDWRSDFLDQAQSLLDQQEAISGLTGEDAAIANRIDTPGSLTSASLTKALAPDVMLVGSGIDPTGAADSTTALQAKIDANPGRRLRFPTGVFKFSRLTLSDGQTLIGSGWQDFRDRHVFFGNSTWNNAASFSGTILRSTATTGVAITIYDTEVNTGGLAEFFLIGPGSGTSTGILLGGTVVEQSVVHPVWENVKVGNFYVGVKMQWVNEGGIYDLTIHGCETGLLFGDYVNQNAFYMLDLQRCDTALLMNSTCAANTFYSPIAQVCGTGFVVSGQKTALINPYVEGTTTEGGGPGMWGIDIAGGVGNTVHAPLLSSATDGIRIRAGANDSTITAFGYDGNSATLSNAGARSYLQGYFTGLLTDTGTNTVVIDSGYAGSAFGPRKTWSPTFDAAYGGSFAVGNGTVTGKYSIIGKTMTGSVEFTKGSTSVMSGQIRLLLPVTAAAISTIHSKVTMLTANGNFVGASISDAASNVIIGAFGTGGALANLSASVPAFWTTGDKITVQFTCEVP